MELGLDYNRYGKYIELSVTSEKYKSFLPPLLPFDPPLQISDQLNNKIRLVSKKLNDLDNLLKYDISKIDPFNQALIENKTQVNIDLFLYFSVRKEALLSSQIEGTQSSFDDLLLYENNNTSNLDIEDVEEVSNYVAALNHGVNRINNGFPLCSRLIREIHAILLRGGRGSKKHPGEFRTSQNWIGGSRPGNAIFVPPPHETLLDYMSNLEKYINGETSTIIKAAIVHAQFETIHPFLDGNGRLGRLLITLLLCNDKILQKPILYSSLYLKEHRNSYYELLNKIRKDGDWESWVDFFVDAISDTTEKTCHDITQITNLIDQDLEKILKTLGPRAIPNALKLYVYALRKVNFTIQSAAKELWLSQPTIIYAIENLKKLSIILESTGKQRDRAFVYDKYLSYLKRGT